MQLSMPLVLRAVTLTTDVVDDDGWVILGIIVIVISIANVVEVVAGIQSTFQRRILLALRAWVDEIFSHSLAVVFVLVDKILEPPPVGRGYACQRNGQLRQVAPHTLEGCPGCGGSGRWSGGCL